MNCLIMAQTSMQTLGKPIRIGKLDVAQYDLPKKLNWYDAKKDCAELGNGWRLPTREELSLLYQNRQIIGGFTNTYYWSSSETNDQNAWRHNFSFGMSGFIAEKHNEYMVRAVKVY